MHVLMISFDPSLIHDGEARQRHITYAERAGQLTIVTHTGRGAGAAQSPSPCLTIIPSGSLHTATFPVDAYRLALAQARQQPIDLITTQDLLLTGLVGVGLRRKLRVPLLVQNHSYLFGNDAWLVERPLRNRALLRLARFVIQRADMVRTVNRKERENAIAMGIAPERVMSLPLGTASAHFAAPVAQSLLAQRRAELGLAPDQQVVLWVGYPVAFKRVPLLFRVFRRVVEQEPETRLLLLGDMSRSPQDLDAAARAEGIAANVIMRGPIRHDDLPGYYQLAQVYVHTSSYEGVPRVLFEASAAGLPLVGLNVVGVDEVIQDGVNGCLVPDGDVVGMAAAIVGLLRDPQRAHTFGQAAQRVALKDYNADDYAEKWVSVWRRAVELGRRS
jgi:glycosyltransferase involved in cell wall biosynthesis